MNAERLHAVLQALKAELDSGGIQARLQKLESAHNAVMGQPNEQTQHALASVRDGLATSLEEAPSNHFGPAWKDVIADLGGSDLVGESLLHRLDSILQGKTLLATAHNQLVELVKDFSTFKSAIDATANGLSQLNVGTEDLPAEQAEFGILIPRSEVDQSASDLGRELQRIDRHILRAFSEVVTGAADGFRVERLSSTAFGIDLAAASLPTVAALGAAITWALNTYLQVLKIKKARTELSILPDEIKTQIEEYANNMVDNAVKEKVPELIKEYASHAEKSRKHELKKSLSNALKQIIARIDRGYSFEIRVGPSKNDAEEDQLSILLKIRNFAEQIQRVETGSERILQLPAPNEEEPPPPTMSSSAFLADGPRRKITPRKRTRKKTDERQED